MTALHSPAVTALHLLQWQSDGLRIPTGNRQLDEILDGGVFPGEVTELIGRPSTGKTQLCLSACVQAARHGLDTIFIDTLNCFNSSRIIGMNNKDLTDSLRLLSHIKFLRVFSIFQMLTALQTIDSSLSKTSNVRLLIVDSVASCIMPILGGQQPHGHAMMATVGRLLNRIAQKHQIAVLITNYMVGADGSGVKPALGESWSHVPSTQMLLAVDPVQRLVAATVTQSPRRKPGATARFVVDGTGIGSEIQTSGAGEAK
eukprot:TRINITY_DN11312_c0_g1_i2.p1 TRINITY_DN11312_c0_g1~~TRINITY_DN11312_c0_g1_i2.p1  ORF type:complete len:258 (+),score=41.07 TRINITY_DN11312_c0_g1_i2:78-851(+)